MPIYTKKGDRGETGLFNGKRISKSDLLIEAIGAVDELNAVIGVAVGEIKSTSQKLKIVDALERVQKDLFGIGAALGGYRDRRMTVSSQLEKRVTEMEKEIDRMWKEMPPLSNFILPRGRLHLARTVCRRAERAVVRVQKTGNREQSEIVKFLNRLGDYLFCLARWENFKAGEKEVVWRN